MKNDLQIGQVYYRIGYADRSLTVPSVEPMVFLGTNVFEDDLSDETTYHFQEAGNFFFHGIIWDIPNENDRKVISEKNRDEIFDLNEVIDKLTEANSRSLQNEPSVDA